MHFGGALFLRSSLSEISEYKQASKSFKIEKFQNINMEVHHHPHPEKKGFREYFLEGVMIFLAVTMGFVAENIREKITENARARELAESMYQEVYTDSVQLQKIISSREHKEAQLVNLIRLTNDSNVAKASQQLMRSLTWSFLIVSPIIFEPADGILTQLRNSGSLRYFKNTELQKEFGALSVTISKVRSRLEVENSYSQQYVRPLILKFYNFKWYNELTKNGSVPVVDAIAKEPDPKEIPVIYNAASFNKTEIINTASYYLLILRGTRQIQLKNYMDINHTLLETLRKEYNLKGDK